MLIAKAKKHTQSKRNCESTIKGSISKREDHADSTQIGRTLYSGMKRESSQSHTSGTVHSSTHLTIEVVVRVEVRCQSCRGSGQGGSHGVTVVIGWSSWKFELSVVSTANVHSHTGLDANSLPNINHRQKDHMIRNYVYY